MVVNKISKMLLDDYVTLGKLKVNKHPNLPLSIYKYTPETEFNKDWDDITMTCRGLVVDNLGNIITRPFKKFFNIEDVGFENLPNLPFTIYEKLDGSLIEIFKYKGELIIATMGSFNSEQVNSVKALWFNKPYNNEEIIDFSNFFDEGFTYLFEFISPYNQIVVKYDNPELILLDVINNKTGVTEDSKFNFISSVFKTCPIHEQFNNLTELLSDKKRSDFNNKEGFVIKYDNHYRVKVKYDEYFRLHKLLSNINKKWVWELLKDGKSIMEVLENVPDEFMQQLKGWEEELRQDFKEIEATCKYIYEIYIRSFGENTERKQYAKQIMQFDKKYHAILFNMLDGFNYDKFIWKLIEPKGVN